MGVNTFLLDRRTTTLIVGGSTHTIGTLRAYFKVTELDDERVAALDAAARIMPSPTAALIMNITELPLASRPQVLVAAHLVLGWDEGRGSVTDFGWDYLPQLGYAVRDPTGRGYILYEQRSGALYDLDSGRAQMLGLLDINDRLIRRGQPKITHCRSVKPYIPGYAEADCRLENGADDRLLIGTPDGGLPPNDWFVGKRPMDVQRYSRSNNRTL